MNENKLKILHIDDDKTFFKLVRHYISKIPDNCYTVEWEETYEGALKAFEEDKYDLYLLDFHLPKYNGLQILKKSIEKGCTRPIIMLTGEESHEIDIEAMKVGAADYLNKKGLNASLLGRSIRYALERKRTEEELRLGEENYRSLFNRIADSIFIFSKKNNRFLDCNETALRKYGYSLDDLQKMTMQDLLYAPKGDPDSQLSSDKGDIGISNIYTHKTKTKKQIRVEVVTDEIEYHGLSAWLLIARDVTERVRAFQETELLLSAIPSILIAVGGANKIIRLNSAAENTFGIKAENVLGQSLINSSINWNWAEIFQAIEEFSEKKITVRLEEVKYTRPDGKQGILSVSINPVVEDLYDMGFVILAEEITERKALETQLSNAQKLESIGQLAAGIAHEINTPIQYIGDNTHFINIAIEKFAKVFDKNSQLLKAAADNEIKPELIAETESIIEETKIQYMLEEIPMAIEETLAGVDRVATIVRAMKEFSHPGTKEKTLTDINKSLENTITVARNEWKYVAEVVTEFDDAIPLVPCMPGELNQVFLNLIVNAAHAIEQVVEDNSGGKGEIKICTSHIEDSVQVKIIDTGAGIPNEAKLKIFDPFFTTKKVGKGTGQGLAIAHNVVVEKHGGSIDFDTTIGKGTTFVIHLPIEDSTSNT